MHFEDMTMDFQTFCYWLQGRAELKPDEPLSPEEWKMVKQHLALVFNKVTPALGQPTYVGLQDRFPGIDLSKLTITC